MKDESDRDHLITESRSPLIKRWKDLSPTERRREIIRAAHRHGGKAVTLNLTPSFAKSLVAANDPMRKIRKCMNAELRAADLAMLPVLLVLEAERKDGRPHLHGVFVGNGIPTLKIQYVMRKAVGSIPGRSGSRQFKAKNLYAPDGWKDYIHKDLKSTLKLLKLVTDERLSWVSRSMTQMAVADYESIRLGLVATSNSNAQPQLHAS